MKDLNTPGTELRGAGDDNCHKIGGGGGIIVLDFFFPLFYITLGCGHANLYMKTFRPLKNASYDLSPSQPRTCHDI